MQKQPFVITLGNEDLPNLATDNEEDYGIEFSSTKIWQENNNDIAELLGKINEKLDIIINIIRA